MDWSFGTPFKTLAGGRNTRGCFLPLLLILAICKQEVILLKPLFEEMGTMLYVKIEIIPPPEYANANQEQSFVMFATDWQVFPLKGYPFISCGSIVPVSISGLRTKKPFKVPLLLYQEDSSIRVSFHRTVEDAKATKNPLWQQVFSYMLPEPHFPKPERSPYWLQMTEMTGTWTKSVEELAAENWHPDVSWKPAPVLIEEDAHKDPAKRTPVASYVHIFVDKVVVTPQGKKQSHPLSLYIDRVYRLQKFAIALNRDMFPWLQAATPTLAKK